MKKRSIAFIVMLLVGVLCLALCGCSSYRGIRAAFEKAGYTESSDGEEIDRILAEELGEEYEAVCAFHVFEKSALDVAVIVEFKSTKELEDTLKESATLQGIVKDIQKSDYVSGNCLFFPLLGSPSALEIFKSTK